MTAKSITTAKLDQIRNQTEESKSLAIKFMKQSFEKQIMKYMEVNGSVLHTKKKQKKQNTNKQTNKRERARTVSRNKNGRQ